MKTRLLVLAASMMLVATSRARCASAALPAKDRAVLRAVKAFADAPLAASTRESLGEPRLDAHETNDGWRRLSYVLPASTFSCDVAVALSPSNNVVAWEYYCGPTGRKELPIEVTKTLKGDWIEAELFSGHFAKRYGRRAVESELARLPKMDADERSAFDYLRSMLSQATVGASCGSPAAGRRIDPTLAVQKYQILAHRGRSDIFVLLLESHSPEAEFLAAHWLLQNPRGIPPEVLATARQIVISRNTIGFRRCGPRDTYSVALPMRDVEGIFDPDAP